MSDAATDKTEDALLRNQAFLRSLALSLLGDEHLADDVVQSTWVAALEGKPHVQNWPAWAGMVVRNLAAKLRRGRDRQAAHERAQAEGALGPPAGEILEREETLRAVTDAVLALEQPYRRVVMMRFFEGLRPGEIAARSGEPVATIKSQLQRGLRLLRKRLDRHSERSTWGAALAALVGERPATAALASTSATTGVIAMSIKSKFSLAALALIFLAGGGFLITGGDREHLIPHAPLALEPALLDSEAHQPETGAIDAAEASLPPARSLVDTDRSGSISLQVRYADRGDPAVGVGVKVTVVDHPHVQIRSFLTHADEHGEVHLEGLHPGRIIFVADRGGFSRVELEPGGHANATLTIPLGIDIEGAVIDENGFPVADAEIWLSNGNATEGGRATIADSGGRFLLRSVGTSRNVMARKHGYAPSNSHIIEGSSGDTHELTLTLPRQGATVEVLVEDANGVPVAGARVRLATAGDRWYRPNPKRWTSYFKPIDYVLTTNEDGACIAESLSPGSVKIMVNGIDYAPWEEQQELPAGETTVRVQLIHGASVAGRVTSSIGEPVEGAIVRVGTDWQDDTRKTVTGPDGQYRIDGVGVREFVILATAADQGEENATLVGASDEVTEWNPILDSGLVLQGRVIDEAGQGLANWSIMVSWSNLAPRHTRTDADGQFRMINCPKGNLFLELTNPRQYSLFGACEYGPFRAGGEPIELRVLDRNRMQAARLSGHILTTEGEPIAARLLLSTYQNDTTPGWSDRSHKSHMMWSDHSSGQFKIDALAPGSYTIAITSEHGSYDSGKFDLLANEKLDLGDLQVGGPGKLQIKLKIPDGSREEDVWVYIHPQNSYLLSFRVPSTAANAIAEAYQLPAGVWIVRVSGSNTVSEQHLVKIESGKARQLTLALRAGAWVRLSLRSSSDEQSQVIRVRVFTATGEQVAERVDYLAGQSSEILIRVPPADSYRVLVEARDGSRGEIWIDRSAQWLEPSSGTPRPAAVEVVLR